MSVRPGSPIVWLGASAALLVGACGTSARADPSTATGTVVAEPTTADPPAPAATAPTTTTTSTTTAPTSSTPAGDTTTMVTSTTPTITSTTLPPASPSEVPTLLSFDRPVRSAAVFGDSMFASGTGASELFGEVEHGLADLGIERLVNDAIAGQAYVHGSELGERGWHRLADFLEDRLPEPGFPGVDLALINLSRIDLNVLPPGADVDARVDEIVVALERSVAMLETAGVAVAIIPAFGTNDEMFDGLQCGRGPEYCWAHELDAKVTALNRAVAGSGLPLLFERFAGTDLDGVDGTDSTWFTDFDPTDRWPDDGQHPNLAGERLIADNIVHHVAEAMSVPIGAPPGP